MNPTFSRGRSGQLYRYYVSASLQQGGRSDDRMMRLPATAFEQLVSETVARWLPNTAAPLDLPLAIRLREHEILIDLPGEHAADISTQLRDSERVLHSTRLACRVAVPMTLPLRGGRKTIALGSRTSKPDRSLIHSLRRAHSMIELHRGLPFLETAPASHYHRGTLALAFLAPDIQRDILAGRQPARSRSRNCATLKSRCAGSVSASCWAGLRAADRAARVTLPRLSTYPAGEEKFPAGICREF